MKNYIWHQKDETQNTNIHVQFETEPFYWNQLVGASAVKQM